MFVWCNVRSRCLFVTLCCCIDYNVIIDCNGQVIVLSSTIKMQTSLCSHQKPVCSCVCGCSLCVYVRLHHMDSLGLIAAHMMNTLSLRKFQELEGSSLNVFPPGIHSLEELQVSVSQWSLKLSKLYIPHMIPSTINRKLKEHHSYI